MIKEKGNTTAVWQNITTVSLSRLSVLQSTPGLLALLSCFLSVSTNMHAEVLPFTFEYVYTITPRTCVLYSKGTAHDALLDRGSTHFNFDISWGKITKSDIRNGERLAKTFGIEMRCDDEIPAPELMIMGDNRTEGHMFAIPQDENVPVGFEIKEAADTVSQFSEDNRRKSTWIFLLTAWPSVIPGASPTQLKSGSEIMGTVTIKVSYN
ncbi:TPA: hypothetical protein ACIBE3_004423 [Salmonella enterica subsp. enterica serovar Reading]